MSDNISIDGDWIEKSVYEAREKERIAKELRDKNTVPIVIPAEVIPVPTVVQPLVSDIPFEKSEPKKRGRKKK